MAKSKKQQAAIAVSMKKQGNVPAGYHKMPDGKIMKNSAHKKKMQYGGTDLQPEISTFKNPKVLPEVSITTSKPNTLDRIKGGVRKVLKDVGKSTGKGTAVRAAESVTQNKMKKGGTMKMKMGGAMKKKK